MIMTCTKTFSIRPNIFNKSCRGINKLTLATNVHGRRTMYKFKLIYDGCKLVGQLGAGIAASAAIDNADKSKTQSVEERAAARAEIIARRLENEPPSPSAKPSGDTFLHSTIEQFDIEYWTFDDVLAVVFVAVVFCYFVFRVFLAYEVRKQGAVFVESFLSDAGADFNRLLASIAAGAFSPALARSIQEVSSKHDIARTVESDCLSYTSQLQDFIASSDFTIVFSCVFVTLVWIVTFFVQRSARR